MPSPFFQKLKNLVATVRTVPRIIRYGTVFFLIQTILIVPPWQQMAEKLRSLERHETEILYNSYVISVESYRKATEILQKEVLSRTDILYWVAQANTTDAAQQNEARQRLYRALKDTYATLQSFDLRQLHFHLPNGTSLLRFHRPDKFGDNLLSMRYSIKLVNELKKPVQGFEEGRTFSGFRYVFPLFYQGRYIGSVETSASFNAIATAMKQVIPHQFNMILKKQPIEAKLYSDERNNYQPTSLSDDYIEGIEAMPTPDQNLIAQINQQIRPLVHNKLKQEQSFITGAQVDYKNYLTVFVPIYNIQRQIAGYLVGYHQSDALIELQQFFYKDYIGLSIINILIFAFFGLISRSRYQIESQNVHLNALIHEKNELMGIVAHDLKNPLSAIQGYAEELHDEVATMDNDEIRLYAGKIQDSARRTFGLINNLLDVNALEAGRIRVVMEKTRLDNILTECVARHQDQAAQKQITLELSTDSYLIMTDIQLFHQIMDNLISNAIKYSQPQTQVHVHVYRVEGKVHCVVEDQGPGLSAEDREKLFGKFTRLTPKPTAGEHSTGLGLFIVKKLVDTLEGQIWCESELGQGSRFVVQLCGIERYNTHLPN